MKNSVKENVGLSAGHGQDIVADSTVLVTNILRLVPLGEEVANAVGTVGKLSLGVRATSRLRRPCEIAFEVELRFAAEAILLLKDVANLHRRVSLHACRDRIGALVERLEITLAHKVRDRRLGFLIPDIWMVGRTTD